MNHQPFYHCIAFAEPVPESKADKNTIEALIRYSVPKALADDVEYCGGEVQFTAYQDVTREAERRLTRAGFLVVEGSEAEPGDPADLC